MSVLRNIADGLRFLFRKEQVSRELDEELNGFLEMAVDEKVKQGMRSEGASKSARKLSTRQDGNRLRRRCGGICGLPCVCCAKIRVLPP